MTKGFYINKFLTFAGKNISMKKLIILLVSFLTSFGVFAQTWKLDKDHSNVNFEIDHLLISEVSGSFQSFDASIVSYKDDLSDAIFSFSADISGVTTGNAKRDKHIKEEDFFDEAKFPKLTFKSVSFTKTEGNNYKLVGDITIKGVTKPITLDVVMKGPIDNPMNKKKALGIKATGKLDRSEFGVGGSSTAIVGGEVRLVVNGEFAK